MITVAICRFCALWLKKGNLTLPPGRLLGVLHHVAKLSARACFDRGRSGVCADSRRGTKSCSLWGASWRRESGRIIRRNTGRRFSRPFGGGHSRLFCWAGCCASVNDNASNHWVRIFYNAALLWGLKHGSSRVDIFFLVAATCLGAVVKLALLAAGWCGCHRLGSRL